MPETLYIFVIDTNSYAGNFEREMGAYVTGTVGDCGVGSGLVEEEIAELFDDYMYVRRDDSGCYHSAHIWLNGKGAYNSVGLLFSEHPTVKQMVLMSKRAKEFAKQENIKIKGFRLLREETILTPLKIGDIK